MKGATVSSWSCFCWLYRASSSLAEKNIINLILVLTIWWCPCVVSSPVLLEECVRYDQCILLTKLFALDKAFALLHPVFQGQICLLLHVLLRNSIIVSSKLTVVSAMSLYKEDIAIWQIVSFLHPYLLWGEWSIIMVCLALHVNGYLCDLRKLT